MSAAQAPAERRWIGPAAGRAQIAAAMVVGVVGVLIPGLQPILLGALADAHRLTAAQLGQTATIELFAMGVSAGLAGALLKPERLRLVAVVAGLALILADAGTRGLSGLSIMADRAAAGVAEGLLIWVVIGMIVRAPTPERWAGVYLTVQTLSQFALATAFTHAVIPRFGADGGFLALAAVSVLAILAVPWLPRRYVPLETQHGSGGLPSLTGLAALLGVLLYLAFLIGVWVYLGPLSQQFGLGLGIAGTAVSVSLGMQVLGGAAATWLAGKLPELPVIIGAGLANLAILALLASGPSAPVFIAAAGLFGFLWLFVMPFQAPFVIAADPTRRAGMLMAGAQLLGSALGPLSMSMVVSDRDARGALGLGGAFILASLVIVAAIYARGARARPRTAR